ncbi:MAG: ScyD/ScyE family protein [Ilumatobacteraceae bacterium]
MNRSVAGLGLLLCCASPLLLSCGDDSSGSETVLDGLSQPRGMSVDATTLCVAEAGAIGPEGPTRETPGQVESDTGRVVCVPRSGGTATAIVDELPFVYYPDAAVTSGASDVVRADERVFALVGESYGEGSRSILEIMPSGPRVIADLFEFAESSDEPSGVVRSNPYSFVITPDHSAFFVTEAAAGTVLRADLDGAVELFAAVPGHEVLTGMSWGPDGLLYVASFGQLPHPAGSGAVVAVDATGAHDVVVDGLTMAIDVSFDSDGAMYVLEYATPTDEPQGVDAYRDRSGRLVYVPAPFDGEQAVLLDDLDRPTALSVSGDDVLISVSAGELAAEEGSVVRFSRADLLRTVDMSSGEE